MYLQANDREESQLVNLRYIRAAQSNAATPSWFSSDNGWVFYTAIAALVLLLLIVIVIIYDLCCRCIEARNQRISDGGPPSSPAHQHSFTFKIRVDEASPTFDIRDSIIRLELLDNLNQYLTSLAIPCFLFKFKTDQWVENRSIYPNPPIAIKSPAFKSMSTFHETWANTTRGNQITFHLVRRNPLTNLSFIRISHDCFQPETYITFKFITVRDDATGQMYRAVLQNKPIRAIHPCPPTGLQVFSVEKV